MATKTSEKRVADLIPRSISDVFTAGAREIEAALRAARAGKPAAKGKQPREPRLAKPKPVHIRPLPLLKWDDDWNGSDTLKSWKGYQSRGGAYTSHSSARPSTGKVHLRVAALYNGRKALPPAPEQIAAYKHLKQNEAAITATVIAAVFKAYPKWRKQYGSGEEDYQDAAYMPAIGQKDELRRLIGLGWVHVLDVAKGGVAYLGFELGCCWDEEHGLGILTHKGKVVKMGVADLAFDSSEAKSDGGRRIRPPTRSGSVR